MRYGKSHKEEGAYTHISEVVTPYCNMYTYDVVFGVVEQKSKENKVLRIHTFHASNSHLHLWVIFYIGVAVQKNRT